MVCPTDFPLTRCGSSLFTASLALEVAEHSHTDDGPSRYVLDLVAHRVAHSHQYHQQYVCAAPTVFRARRLHLPGATGDATTQSLFPRLLRLPLPQPRRKEGETGSPRIRELFNRFMRALESRYRESRDVSYYADLLNVSAKYLGIVTRRITGHTAKSVIDHYVVLQIKQSLATEEKSIKELSWDYHFCDISFFCRYFKQHTGLTPPTIPQALIHPSPISLSNLIRRSTMSVSNTSW